MNLHVAVSGFMLGPPSGANQRLLALLRAVGPLLGDGERVTVLHGDGFTPPALPGPISWRPVPVPARPSWRRALAERHRLPRLLRELDADVLDHGLLPVPAVPCPVLLTIHDLRHVDGFGTHARWLHRRVLVHGCRRAAAVVVPSAFTAARLRDVVPGVEPEVIPNGVDAAPAASPSPGLRGHLLHVGHLEPRKNLAVLLHALAALPAAERPLLKLAGADAGEGPRLRALAARLGLEDRVQPCGVVSAADLLQLYARARAVVVPSRYEGFGLCALEGLAHGRPVLVADAGALPEVVGDQGVVLPPDDAAAWAAAIGATASDGPAAFLTRRARAA